jgi:hypothetical protein
MVKRFRRYRRTMNRVFKSMILGALLGDSIVLALTFFKAFFNESKSCRINQFR